MSFENWHALVVEDEIDGMELVRDWLTYYGIQSTAAHNAEQALVILETLVPTVMIIDLELPGMDGWSLLRAIQQDSQLSGVPCVAITAYHTNELARQAVSAGFNSYLSKPLEIKSFIHELQRVVEG
jgi:two-component system cell cycle response regulator DivK